MITLKIQYCTDCASHISVQSNNIVVLYERAAMADCDAMTFNNNYQRRLKSNIIFNRLMYEFRYTKRNLKPASQIGICNGYCY